jgi:D-sedoheptulose 7-phosphate isomerase
MGQSSDHEIAEYLIYSAQCLTEAMADQEFIRTAGKIIDAVCEALRAGNKILLAGNGGSAGDAQHIAGEFLSRLYQERAPLPAIALTTDSSIVTAIANDFGYDYVFERQIAGLGNPGDVFIAISTSGRSVNILQGIKTACDKGLTVIGFTGQTGDAMAAVCDLCLIAPSTSTPIIQQIHITAAHIICALVEKRLFPHCDG